MRWILTYQSFTGVTDKTKLINKPVSSGWLYGLNPVFAQGENLFQTLMLNLVFSEEYKEEKPFWEFENAFEYIEFLKDEPLLAIFQLVLYIRYGQECCILNG